MTGLALVIFVGLPGSGKTTLAQPFAAARGWTYVNRDEIRAARYADLGPEVWKVPANAATENEARAALSRRESVVVDGMTFATPALRDRFAAAAAEAGARFGIVWVDCPVDEAIRRVTRSNADHPAASERNADRVREVAARFHAPGPEALRLNAMQPLAQLSAALQAGIDRLLE